MEIVREPIGLRVLIRALRPHDLEPVLLWRADPQAEFAALIEVGERDDRAWLWASLLRWREAQTVAEYLNAAGWSITLRGVRAIALARAVDLLQAPRDDQGYLLDAANLRLRAVPETPTQHEDVARLLAFLDSYET